MPGDGVIGSICVLVVYIIILGVSLSWPYKQNKAANVNNETNKRSKHRTGITKSQNNTEQTTNANQTGTTGQPTPVRKPEREVTNLTNIGTPIRPQIPQTPHAVVSRPANMISTRLGQSPRTAPMSAHASRTPIKPQIPQTPQTVPKSAGMRGALMKEPHTTPPRSIDEVSTTSEDSDDSGVSEYEEVRGGDAATPALELPNEPIGSGLTKEEEEYLETEQKWAWESIGKTRDNIRNVFNRWYLAIPKDTQNLKTAVEEAIQKENTLKFGLNWFGQLDPEKPRETLNNAIIAWNDFVGTSWAGLSKYEAATHVEVLKEKIKQNINKLLIAGLRKVNDVDITIKEEVYYTFEKYQALMNEDNIAELVEQHKVISKLRIALTPLFNSVKDNNDAPFDWAKLTLKDIEEQVTAYFESKFMKIRDYGDEVGLLRRVCRTIIDQFNITVTDNTINAEYVITKFIEIINKWKNSRKNNNNSWNQNEFMEFVDPSRISGRKRRANK
jgi:hypothetical protein